MIRNPAKTCASGLIGTRIIYLLCALSFPIPIFAADVYDNSAHGRMNEIGLPAISIIIDDLGYTFERDIQIVKLPAAITCSILPGTPHGVMIAERAHRSNKEILLHQPMQSSHADMNVNPGGLTLDMTFSDFQRVVKNNLESLPYIVGINNHQGSLLSQHPGHMSWLMEVVSSHQNDLFMVDSFTTHGSVISQIASEHWIPNIRRDIFLDNIRTVKNIERQFYKLLATARKNGIALAIGHPYPETITVLKKLLPTLAKKGYHIVPVSTLVNIKRTRFKTWQASLSR